MSKREQELNQALEAMHFGFRSMTFRPDQRLATLGLSRVHHRLLYFIGRNPDCSVNELLGIMRVSKQYLHKPLKTMIETGHVKQSRDSRDRRVKRLQLSASGKKLEAELSGIQRRLFAEVFRRCGKSSERHWYEVMQQLIASSDL